MYIGDQNGIIHIWDLKTDANEQIVSVSFEFSTSFFLFFVLYKLNLFLFFMRFV